MPLPIYTSAAFTNGSGVSVASNASVEVRRESDGSLVPIFEDRDGENQITQPGFQADLDGRFEFYAEPSADGWEITVTSGSDTHTLKSQFPQGGVFGIPEGERALHTGDNSDALSDIPEGERALHTGDSFGAGVPIGGYVTVQTNLTGAEEPDPETHIKLEAGLTGTGEYNEGKLGSESVTGSAPLVEATAEIVDAESPLNGQVVHLVNTENRYLMPGTSPGAVAFDQMQQITGAFSAPRNYLGDNIDTTGAMGNSPFGGNKSQPSLSTGGQLNQSITFDSADSPDARIGNRTDVKRIEVAVYMRIK